MASLYHRMVCSSLPPAYAEIELGTTVERVISLAESKKMRFLEILFQGNERMVAK